MLIDLLKAFPTEDAAREWFEHIYWPRERRCGHCNGACTRPVLNSKPTPYWCTDCRKYFSVKTGTLMADSKIPLQKWALAIDLCLTSLKSVSSMKLHRDLGITQKSAWFMLRRLREAWSEHGLEPRLLGPVEVDEPHGGHDPVQMALDHARHLLDRLQPAADRRAVPRLPCLARPRAAAVRPQRHHMLLCNPTHGRSAGRCRVARRSAPSAPRPCSPGFLSHRYRLPFSR